MSKIFMKSSWGSDDPTRAAMVFGHSAALASPQISSRARVNAKCVLIEVKAVWFDAGSVSAGQFA
jgi:hypothetical protein